MYHQFDFEWNFNMVFYNVVVLLFLTLSGGLFSDLSSGVSVVVNYPVHNRNGIDRIFKSFPAEKKCVNLKNGLNKESKKQFSMFRTRINNAIIDEANFGGKYIISEWGCGTECQAGVIIDLETGQIFELPVSYVYK